MLAEIGPDSAMGDFDRSWPCSTKVDPNLVEFGLAGFDHNRATLAKFGLISAHTDPLFRQI